MTPALVLICSPADRSGRYQVHLGYRRLLASARDPLTESARHLLNDGVTADTPLILRHAGAGHGDDGLFEAALGDRTLGPFETRKAAIDIIWNKRQARMVPPALKLTGKAPA